MSNELHNISSIEFGIYSPDEIRKFSVCKVENTKLTGPGSVYDQRMGCTMDNNENCVTCGLKKECPGHFGYIELAYPILHPMYYKMISNFLKCFCKRCYRSLISETQIELYGLTKISGKKKFMKLLEKFSKIDLCIYCNSPQPKIVYKTKEMTIAMEYKQKDKINGPSKISIILSVEEIKKIFDNLTVEDIKLLGFDPDRIRPSYLITTVLPVIPHCSRPYVTMDGNVCDDDLTYQYLEIVKINTNLQNSQTLKPDKKIKLENSLRFRISTLINNSKGKAKHPTDSRPFKGIKERLSGKEGRVRGNTQGKRVDFSARTVIGPDPTLKLNQLGIPIEVARVHTIPEKVTIFNIERLTKIVNDGNAHFVIVTKKIMDEKGNSICDPTGIKTKINLQYGMYKKGTDLMYGDIIARGVEIKKDINNNVIIPNDKNLQLIHVSNRDQKLLPEDILIRNNKIIEIVKKEKKEIILNIGDTVGRYLQDGDYVLFNRQPTLHRGSMLAMQVVNMKHKTFRFNLSITKSFNADFDGDEMNLHTPQSFQTIMELKNLISAPLNIISAQESKPIIVITQDALIASYLMTRNKFKLTKAQFNDITMKGERFNGEPLWNKKKLKNIKKVLEKFGKEPEIYNGKGLFSLILPDDLFYEKENKINEQEPILKIYAGVLVEGTFDKNILGNSHNSLIHILNKEYGPEVTSNFIDNIQFIGNAWLLIHGFSIGIEDCMTNSKESLKEIKNNLTRCYTKAQGIEDSTQNLGIREIRVTASLSEARDVGLKLSKEAMNQLNNFLVTVKSGAKGDFLNIAQITGLLGQQNLEGKRVSYQLNNGKRSLPHYPIEEKMDKEREYESRGFVRHSFIRGLDPEELFFHAMAGREGVCDTAMGTSTSGYVYRKLGKNCEDIKVNHDLTVRDNKGIIYQFSYGNNNYDPTKTVKVDGKPQFCDIERLNNKINKRFELGIKPLDLNIPVPNFTAKLLQEKDQEEIFTNIKKKKEENTVEIDTDNIHDVFEDIEEKDEDEEEEKDEDEEEDEIEDIEELDIEDIDCETNCFEDF